jgi:DMSO/TMAO reductase YedYZ molybdopterin-dependent catalytic subunit
MTIARRRLLRNGLSLGAVSLLTGCDLSGHGPVDRALWAMLRFNDRVQAALFNPHRLAATFPPSAITRPFRFNAYYPEYQVRTVDAATWKLQLGGLIADKRPWSLAELRTLPQHSQITRLVCVEGWSVIGQWSGVRLSDFLRRVGAELRAGYVGFKCFDDYPCSIDMASALHPQTILALDFDHAPLTPPWGAPLRLRLPTKLGFKNPKYLSALWVTNHYPGGYWADQGYDWFSGL